MTLRLSSDFEQGIGGVRMQSIPKDWHSTAHERWLAGDQQGAINALLMALNDFLKPKKKPEGFVLQFSYYLFLLEDYSGAEFVLESGDVDLTRNSDALSSLIVCQNRVQKFESAINNCDLYIARFGKASYNILDSAAYSNYKLRRFDEAREAGSQSLALKHQIAIENFSTRDDQSADVDLDDALGAQKIISFSLFGSKPRYLRGALDNIHAAKQLLPAWRCRFYLDGSVPADFIAALQEFDTEVITCADGASLKEKLCWRFAVAWDSSVERLLVRDVDSVITEREVAAVNAWIVSSRPFHVMRDWWTHTDLMLAGMWGGKGGQLPDLSEEMMLYKSAVMETPNVDQWFLRDRVWPRIYAHCLVHDRCFDFLNAEAWPSSKDEGRHVGMNVYALEPEAQLIRIQPLITSGAIAKVLGVPYQDADLAKVKFAAENSERPADHKERSKTGAQMAVEKVSIEDVADRKLDLTKVPTTWISLEESGAASTRIAALLNRYGWENAFWSPGVRVNSPDKVPKERLHAIGVAMAHKKTLEAHRHQLPLLVLEDDVAIESAALGTLELALWLPKTADAIYLGFSRYGQPEAEAQSAAINKISGMYATHAVIYLSQRYVDHTLKIIDQSIAATLPFDIGLCFTQSFYEVYGLNHALFYQADQGGGAHDFETLTRGKFLDDSS